MVPQTVACLACIPAAFQLPSQAYRKHARALHPDKGGTAAAFAALQNAFETLIDPKSRAAYDALAADVRFRPGVAQPQSSSQDVSGVTEAALLQQLLQRGAAHPYAVFDPMSQLCVTCEVSGDSTTCYVRGQSA